MTRVDIVKGKMQSEEVRIEPGVIAIAGPTSSGKSTLANYILTDAQLATTIPTVGSDKFIGDEARERKDDALSRGQTVHVVEVEDFLHLSAANEFLIEYEHVDADQQSVPYALGKSIVNLAQTHLVTAIVNHQGMVNLRKYNAAHLGQLGLLRTVLLHMYEPDITERLQARGESKETIAKRVLQYQTQIGDYFKQLGQYGIILSTDGPFVQENDPIHKTEGNRAMAITSTYQRLVEALKNRIVDIPDHRRYIDDCASTLMGSPINELAKNLQQERKYGLRVRFDPEVVDSYAREQGIALSNIKRVLPTHLIGKNSGYGIVTLVFNQGPGFEEQGNSRDMVAEIFKHMLGVPQYEPVREGYSQVIDQGLCRIDNHLIAGVLHTWGYRDTPHFLRKPDQPIDKLVLGIAKTSDTKKMASLNMMAPRDVKAAYEYAVEHRSPIF